MPRKVSTDDRVEAFDVLARYCWYVDEGDGEAWADLWTPDGVFAGAASHPIRGREAFKQIAASSLGGAFRHQHSNLFADYGETENDLIVRGYNLVTSWLNEPQLVSMGVARYHLIRSGDTWKIKSKATRMLVRNDYPVERLPPGFPIPANLATTWPPLS
jgi:hypothetical protein